MTLIAFCRWLEHTAAATAIAESDWLFPAIESLHVIALTTVVGSIALVDLRLLSLSARRIPVSRLIETTLPLTWAAFVVAVISGALLFATDATGYLENQPFRYKMLLIACAGVNMLVFHFVTGRRLREWSTEHTPAAAKLAGALSLMLWAGTVVLGRWIAFA